MPGKARKVQRPQRACTGMAFRGEDRRQNHGIDVEANGEADSGWSVDRSGDDPVWTPMPTPVAIDGPESPLAQMNAIRFERVRKLYVISHQQAQAASPTRFAQGFTQRFPPGIVVVA